MSFVNEIVDQIVTANPRLSAAAVIILLAFIFYKYVWKSRSEKRRV